MTKTTRLSEIETYEVSLVKRGANKRKFLLTKSHNVEEDMEKLLEQILKGKLDKEVDIDKKIDELIPESVIKAGHKDEIKSAAKAALKLLGGVKENMPKGLMGELGKIAGLEFGKKPEPSKTEKEFKDKIEELEKQIKDNGKGGNMDKDVKTQVDALIKEHQGKTDEVIKGLTETNTSLAGELKVERDLRIMKDFEIKVEGFGFAGEEITKMAKVLKNAKETMEKDNYENLEKSIKESQEKLNNSGLFKELGSSQPGKSNLDGKLTLIKSELKKADPKLTDVQAENKAYEQNPELYKEYLKENPSQGGF